MHYAATDNLTNGSVAFHAGMWLVSPRAKPDKEPGKKADKIGSSTLYWWRKNNTITMRYEVCIGQ
jgi:hypothetical protein